MSLPVFDTQGSLFGSVNVIAGELFEESDRYRLFAARIWPVLARVRPQLEACYCQDNGRAGVEPVLLLGVLIFQFLERVADRAALDMLKYHMGWKLALNVPLQYQGFHPTTLVGFRQRLIEHEQAKVAFSAVLAALQEEGLVPKRGKQRLDSTHILGLVSRMSCLECVRETLRLALEELEGKLALETRPEFWSVLWERYVESKLDFRSPEAVLKSKQEQAGEDILQLLEWLRDQPEPVRTGEQVLLLERVFSEYYELSDTNSSEALADQAPRVPMPRKVQPAASVKNPHDPEAHWCAKGRAGQRKEWTGYKVQVAESIGLQPGHPNEPLANFLTAVVTQGATQSDDTGLASAMSQQREEGLQAPETLFVDAAYISAEGLAQAKAEDRELLGPARASGGGREGFCSEDFDVHVEERRAICPAGKQSLQCSRLEEKKTGKVNWRFEWSTHCHGCALRKRCIGKDLGHRTLVVGGHHTVLQERRREQKSEEFQKRMHERNGIEATHSELVRGHGMRRTRYRGRAKADLQNQFIGAACNIKRWLRHMAWNIQAKWESCVAGTLPGGRAMECTA